ncbi:DUF502 domain-containing protein [bacterium]|jgi:uncharacterized membrane protein|nr:DUF502 domain-containing protein [bacterium]
MSDKSTKKPGIRTNFLYGLVVLLPIIATFWLVYFSIDLLSGPISAVFGKKIPLIFSFVLTMVSITFIGLLTRHLVGRTVIGYMEGIIKRIPVVNLIYNSFKQVIDAVSFQDKMMQAVMIQYPREGTWALAFVTQEHPSPLMSVDGKDMSAGKVAVFVPTTPNPTSGYFLYVPKEDVVKLDVTVEESVKLLMSAGVLSQKQKG